MRDKLLSTGGVTSCTETQVIAAMDAELERLFDARVGAFASGVITITDQKAADLESLKVLGTVRCLVQMRPTVGLCKRTMRNNISAEGRVII